MAYSQNTITDANAANVYAGILEGLLTTAGWAQVDATVPASGQVTHVWKSAGTANLCHYDWYIAITWTSVGTENTVRIVGGAAYDLATHRLSLMPLGQQGIAQANQSAPVTGDVAGYLDLSDGHHPVDPNGYWDTQNCSGFSNQGAPWHQFVVPSSAFGYWASVTLDHFTVFTTVPVSFPQGGSQGNGMYHIGTLALDPDYAALEWTAPNPLMQKSQTYNPDASYGFVPSIIPASGESRVVSVSASKNYGAKLPLLSDEYFDALAWRPGMFITQVTGSGTPPFLGTAFDDGLLIGQAIDWYAVYGGSLGDTVEIDGATYVLSGGFGTNTPGESTSCIAVLVES